MGRTRRYHVVVGNVLLRHKPHRLDVVPRMAPIAPGLKVSERQFVRLAGQNLRNSRSDLTSYEFETAARRFVIEENSIRYVKLVRFAVVTRQIKSSDLADSINRTRVKWGIFSLWRLNDFSEHLAAASEVNPGPRRHVSD